MTSERAILLARIGGAHGIKGEVRAQVFTEDPMAIASYGPLFSADGRTFDVVRAKPAKSGAILALKGVADRNAAEALNGMELFIDRDRLPEDGLDDDEFYQEDLIGLDVKDADGGIFASVIAVHDFGAGIVLELQPEQGASVMIPFSEAAVPELDLDAGWLRVEPVAAGLVDDEPAGTKRPGSRRRRPSKAKDNGA